MSVWHPVTPPQASRLSVRDPPADPTVRRVAIDPAPTLIDPHESLEIPTTTPLRCGGSGKLMREWCCDPAFTHRAVCRVHAMIPPPPSRPPDDDGPLGRRPAANSASPIQGPCRMQKKLRRQSQGAIRKTPPTGSRGAMNENDMKAMRFAPDADRLHRPPARPSQGGLRDRHPPSRASRARPTPPRVGAPTQDEVEERWSAGPASSARTSSAKHDVHPSSTQHPIVAFAELVGLPKQLWFASDMTCVTLPSAGQLTRGGKVLAMRQKDSVVD